MKTDQDTDPETATDSPDVAGCAAMPCSPPPADRRTYWGIYYPGMDEWEAKRSRADAKRDAEALNAFCERRGEDYRVEVKEWPFGRERWLENVNRNL